MGDNLQPDNFFILIVIGISAMLLFAIGLLLVFFTSQRRLLNEKMQQQMMHIKHQEDLLFATIKTQEKERKRIAKDLHDEVGSKLNTILLNLRYIKSNNNSSSPDHENLEDLEDLLITTLATTRQISHDLLPPVLEDFGLAAALSELKEAFSKTDIRLSVDVSEGQERLEDKSTELNLFRVIQELVKNSVIHGEAKNIDIKLITNSSFFKISYKDDGKGFDTSKLHLSKGLGTRNIETRLSMCEARIIYESETGHGLEVEITKIERALA